MIKRETKKIGIIFILGILLISLLNFASAVYTESNTGLFQFFETNSKSICDEEGKDFLLQVTPFGCTPAVVRSDLLEEQNVPVFCQLAATQVNPLIDVEAISSVSFKGNYSKQIAGIAFYPAKAAINAKQNLNSATLNNVGYIVVTLKKQSNESAMPESVEGNLSAKIKYDIKNALGIGRADFYLPVLDETEWDAKYPYYSFWDGRGYIRADDVTNTEATISVYDGSLRKITSTTLEKGQESSSINFPGFDCFANFKLKLNEVANPNKRAKLRVNADVVEVGLNEKFLDNKCQLRSLENNGISQKVTIKCDEDNTGFFGNKAFTLEINPKVNISVNDVTREVGIGDYLYDYNNNAVYVGYIGTKGDTQNLDDLFVYFVAMPKPIGSQANAKLSDADINSISELAKRLHLNDRKTGVGIIDAYANIGEALIGAVQAIINAIKGENSFFLPYKDNSGKITPSQNIFGKTVLINSFAEASDINIDNSQFSSNYENALKDYNEVIDSYSQEKYPDNALNELGEEALYKKIELMNSIGKKKTILELCTEFKDKYPNSNKNLKVHCNDEYKLANSETSETFVLINGKTKKISFDGIYEPSLADYNAEIAIKGPNGNTKILTLTNDEKISLNDLRYKEGDIFTIPGTFLKLTSLYFKYSGGEWQWSLDQNQWMNVPEIIFKGKGTWNGQSPDTNNVNLIKSLEGKDFSTGKNLLFEKMSANEFIQLISIADDSIQIQLNVAKKGLWEGIKSQFLSDTKTLKLKTSEDFGSDYTFTLNNVHIKKSAKVSLIPNINNAESTAEFNFRVGIEKRSNITLAPDMVKKSIETLNKTIGTFENISNVLGNVTSVMSKACFATGVALVAKNFLEGLTGESVARQAVMRGANGWYEICNDLVAKKEFVSEEACLIAKSDSIEKDVSSLNKLMSEQNARIKAIEAKYPGKSQLLEKTIDTDKFMKEYSSNVFDKLSSLGGTFSDPNGLGDDINIKQMKTILNYSSWKSRNYDTEQLKQIELYADIINSDASESAKSLAKERLYSNFLDLQTNYKDYVQRTDTANSLGIDPSKFTFLESENTKRVVYEGLTYGNVNIPLVNYNPQPSPFPEPPAGTTTIAPSTPIQMIQTSEGGLYMVVLDDLKTGKLTIRRDGDGLVVYDLQGNRIPSTRTPAVLEKTYFEKYDENSYKNTYKNPEAKFYETEPYKGLPAVVPFDIANGWYAATKPTMPVLGQLSPYDASARVSNFYLCNVGKNGLEEFSSLSSGDDFCQMVNLGTNQPYNKISGLTEQEATKRVEAAVKAIEQASRQYSSGASYITIDAGYGQIRLKVGSPAVEMPEIKCQDFMSPKECQLMFNVCDPVICPSSRCDFGRAYPVKDVVQSGIIGSIALCLPNIREGIFIPVCLTGIQAGIDNLISVEKSYRDCLQKSLDTGQLTGICDEIHSLYICDFFWRQAAPLANIAIPKIISVMLGQNSHGGGEYLFAQSAWETAQKSFSSFTSYYQTNSPKAFKIRSVSEFIGDKICQVYTSATYPNGADILSSITSVSSPPQFTGRFDEIPFTTVTVPPQSQYKVFYHIFAGKEQGAYYQVYLKADTTSFYQDTATTRVVASGYIGVGEYASETKDFLAPSGYKQMCINVNGQEECGFQEVSTSFAVDYVVESYTASQAENSNIKTAGACVSDANKGIIRICATANPEKGTDAYIGTDKQRWVDVGYCDYEKLRCWIDTESIKDVIKIPTIEQNALEQITNSYLANLTGKNYLTEEGVKSKFTEIEGTNDNEKKITLINEIIDKIYLTNQRGYAFLLRGNAFAELAKVVAEQIKSEGEIAKTSSFYSLNCDECRRMGCVTEPCHKLCPAECPSTSAQTQGGTSEEIQLGEQILAYKCEDEKRTNYTCQFVCPGEKVNCVCENQAWTCGKCEDKCNNAGTQIENVVEKVSALDMQGTGIYQCEEGKSLTYKCQFVCAGEDVICDCTGGNWVCKEQCKNKCGGTTAGTTEDEVIGVTAQDISQIKQSALARSSGTGGETLTPGETITALEAETITLGEETITIPAEDSSDFISSIMEYKDGKFSWGNLYYRFFNQQWYWSQDSKNWRETIHLPSLGEENRQFILSLQGKTYSQGLNLLIERTVKEGNSRGILQVKPQLSSYYSFMYSTKEFSFSYKRGVTTKNVFLRYNDNQWEWRSPDNPNGWMVGVKGGGNIYGEPVALIEYLKNKDFYHGARMMFMLEYGEPNAPIETPTVTEKTFTIDRVGFKIDGVTTYDKDVTRTGTVELVVEYESNCQWLKYQIWQDRALDVKVGGEESELNIINTILKEITISGKYHVDVLCFNPEGKYTKVTSKNLEITEKEATQPVKSEIIRVGFKIEGINTYNQDVIRRGIENVVFLVDYQNCEQIIYKILKQTDIGNVFVEERNSLSEVNYLLSQGIIEKGNYFVEVTCFDAEGKSIQMVSKKMEVLLPGEVKTTTQPTQPPLEEVVKRVSAHCGYCFNFFSRESVRCTKDECENYLSPEVMTKLNINNMKCEFFNGKCIAVLS